MAASMFDELIMKAKDLADAAGKKTAELYEISKYKYECVKLNNELKHLYERLGSSVYSMEKGNYRNPDLIDGLCEEIDDQLARIHTVNDIIADKKNQTVCGVCGTRNAAESTYCGKCGSRIKSDFYDTPQAAENDEASDD